MVFPFDKLGCLIMFLELIRIKLTGNEIFQDGHYNQKEEWNRYIEKQYLPENFFPGANFMNRLKLSHLSLCIRFKSKNSLKYVKSTPIHQILSVQNILLWFSTHSMEWNIYGSETCTEETWGSWFLQIKLCAVTSTWYSEYSIKSDVGNKYVILKSWVF